MSSETMAHSSTEVRELCDVLSEELTMLHLKRETWKRLFLDDEALALLNNTAGGFFWLVQQLLRESIAMGLGRMTDREATAGRDNASIYKLLSMIQSDGCADVDADIATDLQTINGLCGKGGALKNLRHRRFAHSDFATAVRKEPLGAIEDEQIEGLLRALDHFLNAVRTSLGLNTIAHSANVILGDAAMQLINSLEYSKKLHDYYQQKEYGDSEREQT